MDEFEEQDGDLVQQTQITEADWVLGRRDAPITLLEYGDFECPYCRAARPILEGLTRQHPEEIRLVFRHFPISTIHPHAILAAEAAEAAGAQGKFWEMHDMLFKHQEHLELEALHRYAEEIGLDMARFDQEMQVGRYESKVKADFRKGIRDGANGTPTIFINGLRYDGPRESDAVLEAIDTRLKTHPGRGR